MTYPLVRFVAGPSIHAAVRFDCNDEDAPAPRWTLADLTFGTPSLEGDPDAAGQTFGFRAPSFTIEVPGVDKADALAALSALAKEQLRPINWLMVQLTATTAPFWLKTYRSGFAPLSLEGVYVEPEFGGAEPDSPDTWSIQVPLTAEAFAYGTRETLPAYVITQASPSDGVDNPMRVLLPPIKGDAPTGLRVRVMPDPASPRREGGVAWLLGCVSSSSAVGDPDLGEVIDIGLGDGYGAGTGTDAGHAAAGYFGGGYRGVTIAPDDLVPGSNIGPRLSGILAATPTIGRHKILLACELTAAVRTTFVLSIAINGRSLAAATVTTGDFKGWVDLGEAMFPVSGDLPLDAGGLPSLVGFEVSVGTSDNTAAAARLDAFKLIPVSDNNATSTRLLRATFLVKSPDASATTFDTDDETWWTVGNVDNAYADHPIAAAGAFPTADPAADRNILILMAVDRGDPGTPSITDVGAEATVTVSYHPRYLHIGDGV